MVLPDLPPAEALNQVLDNLKHLDNVITDLFGRISARVCGVFVLCVTFVIASTPRRCKLTAADAGTADTIRTRASNRHLSTHLKCAGNIVVSILT